MNAITEVSKRKRNEELVLSAAEKRLILAYRNVADDVQESTIGLVEGFAVHPILMRHKAPVLRLVAGGRAA